MKIWQKYLAQPETFFAITAIFFGLLFVGLTPPLQGPDEQAHFAQIYRYSEGSKSPIGDLPKGVVAMYYKVMYDDDIRFKPNERYEIGRTKDAILNIPLQQEIRVDGVPYGGTNYSPLVYLPQIMAVFLGRLFDMPAVLLLYVARLISLGSFVGLTYLAIRGIPIMKWSMATIGLLPMTVFSGSMVSADAITIGSSAVFLSTLLSVVVQKTRIDRARILKIIGVTLLVAGTKLISILILPLLALLTLNRRLFSNRKIALATTATLIGIGMGAAFAWQAVIPLSSGGLNIPNEAAPIEQIKHMITAPSEFLFALWNTYFYQWGDGIAKSVIGTFGWVDAPMASVFVVMGYIILAVVFIGNRGSDSRVLLDGPGRSAQLWTGVTAMAYIIGINAAMYAYYSPVDFNIIVGVQGRYFIPALFIVAIFLTNKDRLRIEKSTYRMFVNQAPIFLLFVAVTCVVLRYYTNTAI